MLAKRPYKHPKKQYTDDTLCDARSVKYIFFRRIWLIFPGYDFSNYKSKNGNKLAEMRKKYRRPSIESHIYTI